MAGNARRANAGCSSQERCNWRDERKDAQLVQGSTFRQQTRKTHSASDEDWRRETDERQTITHHASPSSYIKTTDKTHSASDEDVERETIAHHHASPHHHHTSMLYGVPTNQNRHGTNQTNPSRHASYRQRLITGAGPCTDTESPSPSKQSQNSIHVSMPIAS